MARIRTIKPEFFTSEDVVGLSPFARLLYIALWCESDRAGRLRWKPLTFKMRYFPADDLDIQALCGELLDSGMVRLYGDGLAYIPTFGLHQHVNPREAQSTLPTPENDASFTRDDASVTCREEGKERKGREGSKSTEPDGSHLPAHANSPLPPDDTSAGDADFEPDPGKELFDLGVNILTRSGHSERHARSLIGRLRKLRSDEESASILMAAKKATDPASYIVKCIQPKPKKVQLC